MTGPPVPLPASIDTRMRRAKVELRGDLLDVRRDHVGGVLGGIPGNLAAREVAGFDHAAKLLDGLAVDGGTAADGFEAVELGRIMAAGDHDGGVGLQAEDGIVEHRRWAPRRDR